MDRLRRLLVAGSAAAGAVMPWHRALAVDVSQDPVWQPLTDKDLAVAGKGNALDFSALVPSGPAGHLGWVRPLGDGIGFEKEATPQRFFCANMVFSPPNGGAPDHVQARRWVAELRAVGYRTVRFQFIDAYLLQRATRDFAIDPEALDRVHYLMAELKAAGIGWIVDGMSSDNGGYGDVGANRYARHHDARLDALVSASGIEHWQRLVDAIWGVVNPYTRVSTLRDPALFGVILINEGGISFLSYVGGGRYSPSLAAPFGEWLRGRYGDETALRRGWADELAPDESLDRGIRVPSRIRGRGRRDVDFARFVQATEASAFRRMDQHVREAGFAGLTTAYNSGTTFGSDVTRSTLGWVDMHAYHSLPTKYANPGSVVQQSDLFDGLARSVRQFSDARQWGRPFTASEYGQQFWNGRRFEMGPLVAAMAAHHGWGLISQFAETPVQLDYGVSGPSRRTAIYPNGVAADPIERCIERLVALLYARGDVAASPRRIRLHLVAEDVLARGLAAERVPEAISRLAFVAPLGLDFGPAPDRDADGEVSIELGSGPKGWAPRQRVGASAVEPMDLLRAAKLVAPSNRSDPGQSRYQSDTGEITVDGVSRRLMIETARTCVITVTDVGGAGTVGPLSVEGVSGPALIAVSALDDRALRSSRHLLLWVLTDAVNSGMTFTDDRRTTLERLGTFPPVVRTLSCTVRLQAEAASALKVWPLALNGQRRGELSRSTAGGALLLKLDTSRLPDGPALLFEIAEA